MYLRTSSKTKDRHLGLLQSLLVYSSSFIRLPRGLVSVHHHQGAKCLRTLCSYQEVSLCLVSQVTLRSSTFASSIVCLAKSHLRSTTPHICLSQAYGCSDRYNVDEDGPVKACPSRGEVLKAISTIMEYVSALDNPLARDAMVRSGLRSGLEPHRTAP